MRGSQEPGENSFNRKSESPRPAGTQSRRQDTTLQKMSGSWTPPEIQKHFPNAQPLPGGHTELAFPLRHLVVHKPVLGVQTCLEAMRVREARPQEQRVWDSVSVKHPEQVTPWCGGSVGAGGGDGVTAVGCWVAMAAGWVPGWKTLGAGWRLAWL